MGKQGLPKGRAPSKGEVALPLLCCEAALRLLWQGWKEYECGYCGAHRLSQSRGCADGKVPADPPPCAGWLTEGGVTRCALCATAGAKRAMARTSSTRAGRPCPAPSPTQPKHRPLPRPTQLPHQPTCPTSQPTRLRKAPCQCRK